MPDIVMARNVMQVGRGYGGGGGGVIKTPSENRKVWRQLGNRYTALCIEENHLRCLENCGLIRYFSKKEEKK